GANHGRITLAGNVKGVGLNQIGTIALTSVGTAASHNGMVRTSGTLTGDNVNLSDTGNGDIGSTAAFVQTAAGTGAGKGLTINTTKPGSGSAYIFQTGDVTVNASTVGNDIDISSTGNMIVKAITADPITLTSLGDITLAGDQTSSGGVRMIAQGSILT